MLIVSPHITSPSWTDFRSIASYADCLADPTLVSRQRNPSEPYYLPDRRPRRRTVGRRGSRVLAHHL